MTPGERRHRKRLRRIRALASAELPHEQSKFLRTRIVELHRTGHLTERMIEEAQALGVEPELRLAAAEFVARRRAGPRFVSCSVARPSAHRLEEYEAVYGK